MFPISSILFYITLTAFTTAAGVLDDQPYCAVRYRRLCQGKGRHVGCQFPDPGPGDSCKNYSPIKFHNDLKHFITHYINRRRQRIAAGTERVRGGAHLPKPEVMMLVEWDRELALLAQRLADQCTFVHDDCRATVRYPYAGQTVGEVRWRRSSDSDTLTAQRAIRRVFDAWWGERRRVQPHQLTAPFRMTAKGAIWGHFSQLAVWSLRAVGCGAVRHGTSNPRLLLVCDFSHTNMLGQRTLTPGPMIPCPIHTLRKSRSAYPLLCAPVRHPVVTEQYESETDDDMLETNDERTENEEDDDDDVETRTQSFKNATKMTKAQSQGKKSTRRKDWRKLTELMEQIMDIQTNDDHSLVFRTTKRRKTTKGLFLDKLDQELDGRKKAQHKSGRYQYWQPTSTEEWRIRSMEEYESVPTKSRKQTSILLGEGEPQFRRFTDMPTTSSEPALVVRHKWKQTRDRPQRPGANALLNIPVTPHTHRSSVAAMMLDQEDVDQLFRDTGFNPSWMRRQGAK
ncbi:hypothetical protein ABMA27_009584 [Loxostege sticticalis]|uniref:SCP domain-containing protein n=1 Tax=Loxostege sticticalis TaxID=481309 RepID=A0ABR3H8P2_LOXSC